MKRTRNTDGTIKQTILNSNIHSFQPSPWNYRKMEKLQQAPPMTRQQEYDYMTALAEKMIPLFGWRPWMRKYGFSNMAPGLEQCRICLPQTEVLTRTKNH